MANNTLYDNIEINYCLLKIWKDKFISSGIMDNIVYCNANQYKRKRYVTDLNDNNFENDLNAAIVGISIEGDHINSGCIYSDIDN